MDNYKVDNKFFSTLINLNRTTKQLVMIFVDSVLIVFVLLSSFSLSPGYGVFLVNIQPNYWYWPEEELFWIIFGAPVLAIPIFFSLECIIQLPDI